MKKVVSIMLSLLALGAAFFTSCSVDSDDNGGGREPSLEFEASLKQTEITYTIGDKAPVIYVLSENFLEQLRFPYLTYEDAKGNINDEVSYEADSAPNLYAKRWKITLSDVPQEAGKYTYTLYVEVDGHKAKELTFVLTVVKQGQTEVYDTPEITKQPIAQTYAPGVTPEALSVTATIKSGACAYQWYFNNQKIEGATASTYTPTETGSYKVVVSNKDHPEYFVTSDSATVIIQKEGDAAVPKISSSLQKEYVYADIAKADPLSITATVDGGGTVHAQWYKNSADRSDKVGSEVTGAGSVTATYTPTSFGTYYCKVWNVSGGKTSPEMASDSVEIKEESIVITVSGISATGYTGEALSVTATSNVPCTYTYQWYTTNASSEGDSPVAGATEPSYTPSEEGRYFCSVIATSNATGTKGKRDSSACTVTKKTDDAPATPVITSFDTTEKVLQEGDSLSLSVTATRSDDGVLSYQWYRNGSQISGATSAAYKKENVSSSDAGSYTVIVKNTRNGKTAETKSKAVTVKVLGSTGDVGGDFDFN